MLTLLALNLTSPVLAAEPAAGPACLRMFFRDFDGDTWGIAAIRKRSCVKPPGYSRRAGDCKEGDASVNPDAAEIWYDGIDQDCDGRSDFDADGDGVDSASEAGGYDCDDNDASVGPGTTVGQCATDFELQDSNGNWDSLWNYYGDVILLDLSAGW